MAALLGATVSLALGPTTPVAAAPLSPAAGADVESRTASGAAVVVAPELGPTFQVTDARPADAGGAVSAFDGTNHLVAWTEREPARVDSTGIVRDEDGFAIAANPPAEAWPAMVKGSGIDVGAVWTQHRSKSSGLSEDGVGFLREVSPK